MSSLANDPTWLSVVAGIPEIELHENRQCLLQRLAVKLGRNLAGGLMLTRGRAARRGYGRRRALHTQEQGRVGPCDHKPL